MAKKKPTKKNILVIESTNTPNDSAINIAPDFALMTKTNSGTKDHISLFERVRMLMGHPSVQVELTSDQMENALSMAASVFSLHTFGETTPRLARIKDKWIEQYAIATMKETLSRIRGKFASLPVNGDTVTMDAGSLLSEATAEKCELKDLLTEAADGQGHGDLEEGQEWSR